MAASPNSTAAWRFSGEKKGAWRTKSQNVSKQAVDESCSSEVGLKELAREGGVTR